MDSLYFMALRFSKYLSKLIIILAISFLIFVYFITLNKTKTSDVTNQESSLNHKVLLSTIEARAERDEYAVSKSKLQLFIIIKFTCTAGNLCYYIMYVIK